MTINKSQGQSLKIIGVFLKEQAFTHDQLYVALSRVTSRKELKIISCDNEGRPSAYAKNIVYKDIINAIPRGVCFLLFNLKQKKIITHCLLINILQIIKIKFCCWKCFFDSL